MVAKDYHELTMSEKVDLSRIAKAEGYRKPATASGSTGRAYHAKLQRLQRAARSTDAAIEKYKELFVRLSNR